MNDRIRALYSYLPLKPSNAAIVLDLNSRDTREDGAQRLMITRDDDRTWRVGNLHAIIRKTGAKRVTLEFEFPREEAEALRDYLNYAYPKEGDTDEPTPDLPDRD